VTKITDWKSEESTLNSQRTEKIVFLDTASRFVLGQPASHPMRIMGAIPAVKRIKRTTNPSIPQRREALLFLYASEIAWFLTSSFKHRVYYTRNQFHFLPTQCIYLFWMDLRINIDYFPIQR